jgi:hypothetical protein
MKSVTIARTSVLLSLLLLLLVAPLRADGTLDDRALELRYGLSWGGVQLATLALRHDAGPDGYAAETRMATTGLFDQIARYRGHSRIAGQRGPAGELRPVDYRSESERRNKTRTATLEFDPTTGRVVRLEMTKDSKPRRSNVPEELRRDVVDPLTALLQLRAWAAQARRDNASGPHRMAVFDGRRRFDLETAWGGRERVSLAGRSWPALRLEVRLVPVAGFDDDDLQHAQAGEDALALELLLSDDDRLLPLRVQTLNTTITGVAQLLEDCSAEPGCRLAAR